MGGSGNELQRLTSIENLFLGLAAGMGTKAINYPLLHWKNRSQQGLPISINPGVVYRGLPMAMLNLGGTTAVQFGLTGFFQKLFTAGSADKTLSKEMEMASSFSAGLLSGIPCSMYELIMNQQQKFGGSIVGNLRRIVNELGPKIMFRGTITTMGRESLYTMGMLGGTPIVQRILMDKYNIDKSYALAGGSLIGATTSVVLTHPIDTIKTCMQGDVQMVKYTNITGSYKRIMADSGNLGFFKGLHWRIALISTTFFLVNQLKVIISPVMFPA